MKKIFFTFLIIFLMAFTINAEANETITICGVPVQWNGYYIIEPESNVDITTASLSDFGTDFFTMEYPVSVDTYFLEEGKETQTTVTHIHSSNPGPVVYIAAGVHGDERAAWFAGLLLRAATIKAGDLYVLAPANSAGASRLSRYVTDKQDVNRLFPGNPSGSLGEQLANAIYSDIQRIQPDLVLDLHEAIIYSQNRDFLGSTFIFTTLDEIGDLFFDMLFATQDGTLCHNEFGYNGPGPAGSINSEVSNGLGIPVITVETFRGFEMDRRLCDQLDTVRFVLEYFSMR